MYNYKPRILQILSFLPVPSLTNDAARFRPILVDLDRFVCQKRHLLFHVFDEQQIREDIQIFQPIWIDLLDVFEDSNCLVDVCVVHKQC